MRIFIFLISLLFNTQFGWCAEGDGTPEHTEFEYKIAFELNENFNISNFIKHADSKISKILENKELSFPAIFSSHYQIENQLKPFVFKDIYLDTKNLDVLNRQSSYRLRYRWSKLSDYTRHKLFPFHKSFYPSRCEIQFKRKYEIDSILGAVKVSESRFEFRNESEPFILEENAPSSPWPETEYIEYAKTGKFKEYTILPTSILKETIQNSNPDLIPMITVETIRYRTHLIAEKNPWGWGPNPQQIFIITFDLSTWTNADGTTNKNPIMEVEIEVDRNTATMVDITRKMIPENFLQDAAVRISEDAYQALAKDQSSVKTLIKEIMLSWELGSPLNTGFKYSRMIQKGKTL